MHFAYLFTFQINLIILWFSMLIGVIKWIIDFISQERLFQDIYVAKPHVMPLLIQSFLFEN